MWPQKRFLTVAYGVLFAFLTFALLFVFSPLFSGDEEGHGKELAERSEKEGIRAISSLVEMKLEPKSGKPQIKIFLYDIPEYNVDFKKMTNCVIMEQFRTEELMHQLLQQSEFVTTDGWEADFFYVPVYEHCIVKAFHYNYNETTEFFDQLMYHIKTVYPFWNRTDGRDHVFLWTSGQGPLAYSKWRQEIGNSIFLMTESDHWEGLGHLAPYFSPWKDIIIPGYVSGKDVEYLKNLGGGSERVPSKSILASYFGKLEPNKSKARDALDSLPDKLTLKEREMVRIGRKISKKEYQNIISTTKFCLVPRGRSAWTNRLFESLFVSCVPVVLSDKIRFPFENFIDWTRVVIKFPERLIGPILIKHLQTYTQSEIEQFIDTIMKQRHMVSWDHQPVIEGPFGMILRELERKKVFFVAHKRPMTTLFHTKSTSPEFLPESSPILIPHPLTINGDHIFWLYPTQYNLFEPESQ